MSEPCQSRKCWGEEEGAKKRQKKNPATRRGREKFVCSNPDLISLIRESETAFSELSNLISHNCKITSDLIADLKTIDTRLSSVVLFTFVSCMFTTENRKSRDARKLKLNIMLR